MGNAHALLGGRSVCQNTVLKFLSGPNWPGSILKWSDEDLKAFASCFTSHRLVAGKEVSVQFVMDVTASNHLAIPVLLKLTLSCDSGDMIFQICSSQHESFYIVAEGRVEVQAIFPTKNKKTGNLREFLCKKNTGDMIYVDSMRRLIAESEKQEWLKSEKLSSTDEVNHKSILDVIDTISIKCIDNSTVLELDWKKFNDAFGPHEHEGCDNGVVEDYENKTKSPQLERRGSKINVCHLRVMMESNLKDHLEKLPILKGISYSKLETVVQMCKYRVVEKGEIVCVEGDIQDEVYVVLSGKVAVQALASKRMAEILSERRTEAAKREKEETQKDFSPKSHSSKSLNVIDQCQLMMVEVGRKTQIEWNQRNLLNRKSTSAALNCQDESVKLEKVIPQVDEKRWMELDRNHLVYLGELGPGEYFGEMATFIDLPRSATISASEACLMASLSKYDFRNLYHSVYPSMKPSVECIVKRHMMKNIFSLKSPFLSEDAEQRDDMIERIANCSKIVKLEAGAVVFKENDDDVDYFYFVYHGSLNAERSIEGKLCKIGTLFPGNYFGELAIINKTARMATITASARTVLLAIRSKDFYNCFSSCPEMLAEVIIRMKGRYVDLQSVLNHPPTRAVFVEHLKEQFGLENLSFWEDVSDYKKNFATYSEKERLDTAEKIFEKYLVDDAPDEINVPSIMNQDVRQSVAGKEIKLDIFDKCQSEIFTVLRNDPFARFRRSNKFLEFLQKIRSYDAMESQLIVT
jgi:CRP-like cAMP-binding protein